MPKINGIIWTNTEKLDNLRRQYKGLKVLNKKSLMRKLPYDAPLDTYHTKRKENNVLLILDSLVNLTKWQRENLSQINRIQGYRH